MGVAATLGSEAKAEDCLFAVCKLGIEVGTIDAGTITIAALLDGIAVAVVTDILEDEYVVEACVESLYEYVGLPVSEGGGVVYRTAITVRTLFA